MSCIQPDRGKPTPIGQSIDRVMTAAENLSECASFFDELIAAAVDYERIRPGTAEGVEAAAEYRRAVAALDDVPDSQKIDYR